MHKRIISTVILCWLFCMQASAFPLIATPVFYSLPADTTVLQRSALNSVAPPVAKKQGFFTKVKATLHSFILKKAAPKQAGNPKRLLNIISLSLLIVGLAVPLLSGPIGFLWLVPASLVTGIVALVVKDDGEDQTTSTTGKKKRRSNVAAITAIAISGGLLAFLLILSLTWGGHR